MVHVDDVVEACILAEANSDANREVFILADSKARSTRELYNQLRSELGMSPMSYYLPSCLLHITAFFGLILGRLIGRRLPLDKDSLKKLLGSAWYDGTKITRKLGLRYDNSTKPLLDDLSAESTSLEIFF
jgi:nucleoside-diphosphate-sugar epimerase